MSALIYCNYAILPQIFQFFTTLFLVPLMPVAGDAEALPLYCTTSIHLTVQKKIQQQTANTLENSTRILSKTQSEKISPDLTLGLVIY